MASEKQKYKSLYGGKRKLTASEYLAQILVARQIASRGKIAPDNYWKDLTLLKEVKTTTVFVRKLISAYSEESVIRAFMRPDMSHVYSTFYPGLQQKIEEEQRKLDEADKIKPPEISESREHRKEQYGSKTLLGKLRELE
jgi:hypothetical protein